MCDYFVKQFQVILSFVFLIYSYYFQDDDIPQHCREILEHWKVCQINIASNVVSSPAILENVEEKLAKLLESNVRPTTVQRSYTDEERKIREAILAQYSQVCKIFLSSLQGQLVKPRILIFLCSSLSVCTFYPFVQRQFNKSNHYETWHTSVSCQLKKGELQVVSKIVLLSVKRD